MAAEPIYAEDTPPDSLPPRPLRHHLALTVYWLSNTMLWGALLHLALQSRLSDWFGQDEVGYYLGIMGFCGGLVATVSQIVAGAFSDRSLHPWGRRRPFLVAGTILGMCGLMVLGAAKSFWPFAGGLVLLQLLTNIALGPFTALLPDTVNPREHGKASGFMGAARLIGDTGGLLLAAALLNAGPELSADRTALVAFHDERMPVLAYILAGLMVATMTFTCLTIREAPLRKPPERLSLKGNPDFWWLSVSRAVTNMGFYMFLEVLFFFVKYSLGTPDPVQGNPDAEKTSMLIMLPAIAAAAASSVPSGLLSDRIGRKPLIYLAQFVMAIGATGFALAPNATWAVIAGIPAGIAYGAFTAVEWALACNLLPEGESARYLGIWNASAAVPQVLAFPVAGAVGSAICARVPGLGWRVDFGIAVLCCLVGAYFLKHVRERFAPGPSRPCPPALP